MNHANSRFSRTRIASKPAMHEAAFWKMSALLGAAALAMAAIALIATPAHAETGAPQAAAAPRSADPQKVFSSPADAVAAMVDAVRANDAARLRTILGRGGAKLINSGDTVADDRRRAEFAANYDAANKLRLEGDKRAVLLVGKDEWPMPIPLVKAADGWRFDARQGAEEILKRRIGRNELAAIEVCRAIVDAQREYVAKDQDRNDLLEYAAKFVSTPGNHDGLYWESKEGEPQSPLGPFIAAAAKDGYAKPSTLELAPYYGYYYRLLTKQGKNAPGGALDYMAKGKLIGGFAVVAYPARYRASGVMTFIVNHDGVVYEKDLGKDTAALAEKMTAFDPDSSWKRP